MVKVTLYVPGDDELIFISPVLVLAKTKPAGVEENVPDV